jgi:hypothetical protein
VSERKWLSILAIVVFSLLLLIRATGALLSDTATLGITIQAIPLLEASVDIDPDTLKKHSEGVPITAYVELAGGHDVNEIDVSTISLAWNEETVPAEPPHTHIGDHDEDGVPDLMVKFPRAAVVNMLAEYVGDATLRVRGALTNGWPFEGSDTIRVIASPPATATPTPTPMEIVEPTPTEEPTATPTGTATPTATSTEEPTAINLSANGVIPVAILGSDSFDAAQVDPLTVKLENAAIRLRGKSGNAGSLEDVNNDGFLDLVVHIVDFTVLDGATTATLTGSLYDGTPIKGTDSIVIVHQ